MGGSANFETGHLSGNKSGPQVSLRNEISLSKYKCIINLLILSKQQRENELKTNFSF